MKVHLREQGTFRHSESCIFRDTELTAPALRTAESAYAELADSTSAPPSFLSFLTNRYDPDSPHALLDRVRLKAILFLGSSSKYDLQGAKKEFEEMEVKGQRGLTLERVIIYGKVRLHRGNVCPGFVLTCSHTQLCLDRQALSLLLNTLRDLSSAETYALQSGDPLTTPDVSSASFKLGIPIKRMKKALSPVKQEEEHRRKEGLARLLVEMCLRGGPEQAVAGEEQVAQLLEAQAVHLDTLEVCPLSTPMPRTDCSVLRSCRSFLSCPTTGPSRSSRAMFRARSAARCTRSRSVRFSNRSHWGRTSRYRTRCSSCRRGWARRSSARVAEARREEEAEWRSWSSRGRAQL